MSQSANHSQLAPPFFTPEPGLRRANGIQAHLSYDSPVHGAPPTTSAAAGRVGSSSSEAEGSIPTKVDITVVSSLSVGLCRNRLVNWTLSSGSAACVGDSDVSSAFRSVGCRFLDALSEHRRRGWTGRSCSPHLPADPLHPEHDPRNSGGVQVSLTSDLSSEKNQLALLWGLFSEAD